MAVRTYRLIVEGELSDRLTFALEPITIAGSQGDTTPTGQIRDHAELQGVMQRVVTITTIGECDGAGTEREEHDVA